MEEHEIPTERIQEHLHHHAEHGSDPWMNRVAVLTAIFAVCAAITALLSGHHVNEAMIEQIQSSDQWAFYQAKSIKASILSTKVDLLGTMGRDPDPADFEKSTEYKKEQQEISEKAKEMDISSKLHLRKHMAFAKGVTMFQIAIGIAAIAVLTRKKHFISLGLIFGLFGVIFTMFGFMIRA